MNDMKASTSYGDLQGTISIDFYDSPSNLDTFCEECGINTEKYTPIGIHLCCAENDPQNIDPIEVLVLVVENKVWERKYSSMGEYLAKEEKPKVKEKKTGMNFDDFYKNQIKRFDAILVSSLYKNHDFEIETD